MNHLPGFPRWHGPMGTATRMLSLGHRPQFQPRWLQFQLGPCLMPSQSVHPSLLRSPSLPFPPMPPSIPASFVPQSQPTPCSPTQPCPATPASATNSPSHNPTPPHRRNPPTHTGGALNEYGFDLNKNWQSDADHYDNQKIKGLSLPRSIRNSGFSSRLDIGCDPLKLPLAALLYQQANNHWLRKLTGLGSRSIRHTRGGYRSSRLCHRTSQATSKQGN